MMFLYTHLYKKLLSCELASKKEIFVLILCHMIFIIDVALVAQWVKIQKLCRFLRKYLIEPSDTTKGTCVSKKLLIFLNVDINP